MSQAKGGLYKTTLERICGIGVIECYLMKDCLYLHVSHVIFYPHMETCIRAPFFVRFYSHFSVLKPFNITIIVLIFLLMSVVSSKFALTTLLNCLVLL